MFDRIKLGVYLVALFSSVALLAGCSAKYPSAPTYIKAEVIDQEHFSDFDEFGYIPVMFRDGTLTSKSDRRQANDYIYGSLNREGLAAYQIVVSKKYQEPLSSGVRESKLISYATKLGNELKLKSILLGVVNKYGTASGRGEIQKSRPDSIVSMRFYLVDIDSERVAWTAFYHRENEPASENLLELGNVLEKGIRHSSPAEIFEHGAQAVARELSKAADLK